MAKEQKYLEVRKRVSHLDPEDEQAKKERAFMHKSAKKDAEEFAGGSVNFVEVYDSESMDTADAVGEYPVGGLVITRHFVFEVIE